MARNNRSPWFPLWAMDFYTDMKFVRMDDALAGKYFRAILLDWIEDGIPSEYLDMISKDLDSSAIALLRSCYMAHPGKKGFLTSPRLQKERQFMLMQSEKKAAAGRAGAEAKWNKEVTEMAVPSVCHTSAIGKPMAEGMAKDGYSDPDPDLMHSLSPVEDLKIKDLDPDLLPTKESMSSLGGRARVPKVHGYREGTTAQGHYGKAWLTGAEMVQLEAEFGHEAVMGKITSLDANIENGVKKYLAYKNHAACIRNWCSSDKAPAKKIIHEHNHKHEGFKPHTAATTFEKNLEYLRSTSNGTEEITGMFNPLIASEEEFDPESGT